MPQRDPEKRRAQDAARHAAYNRDPEHRAAKAAYSLQWRYGLTPEARAWMLEQQGGACAIVGCDRDATEVDHDHTDGHVRGLLCMNCNTALGKLGDDIPGLTYALQYLPR